jgi:hypothetical protein
MISAHKLAVAAVALIALTGLSGCGEKDQVIMYEQGKYQGKPDTKPWNDSPGDSIYTTSTWTKGDKSSWETALKARAQGQDEYARTGQ